MRCRDCSTEDSQLHYRSGKMPRCYDCQNFFNLTKKSTGGGISVTREEFVRWKRALPRVCHYCGMTQERFFDLGVTNVRTGKRMESLGVDRIDNMRPYDLDNLVICCGACNAIKSNILTDAWTPRSRPPSNS